MPVILIEYVRGPGGRAVPLYTPEERARNEAEVERLREAVEPPPGTAPVADPHLQALWLESDLEDDARVRRNYAASLERLEVRLPPPSAPHRRGPTSCGSSASAAAASPPSPTGGSGQRSRSRCWRPSCASRGSCPILPRGWTGSCARRSRCGAAT